MRLLTTDEVARRLGVRRETVYAYVSRGLLVGRRHARGKESLFAEGDVEAFAATRRRNGPEPAAPAIHTGITLINDGELHYRGRPVRELAGTATYEEVAGLLWTGSPGAVRLAPSPEALRLATAVTEPLPDGTRLTDRLRLVVAAAAAVDPLRFDLTPAAVVDTAGSLLGTMVDALPVRTPWQHGDSLADRLWRRLSPAPPPPGVLDMALVLLADHDIAASTLAARVAASTRAHPYAVVLAGLAAFDGPLHGAASGLAHRMLAEAVRTGDPVGPVAERLRAGEPVPGFGHRLYPDGDQRAALLLDALDAADRPPGPAAGPARQSAVGLARQSAAGPREQHVDPARTQASGPARESAAGPARGQAAEVIAALADTVTRRSGTAPNIDFALAALAVRHGLPADAGETIFAVARTAGWIAHALEEYADRPLRFRPDGRYSGRPAKS